MRDFEGFLNRSGTPGRIRLTPAVRIGLLTLMLPVAVLVAILVSRPNKSSPSGGTAAAGSAPVAGAPLLSHLPATTPPEQVVAGMEGGSAWSLWVKVSPEKTTRSNPPGAGDTAPAAGDTAPAAGDTAPAAGDTPTFGPGLELEMVTSAGTGGGGGDPSRMDALVADTFGPRAGLDYSLVYGVTSLPATGVLIESSEGSATLSSPTVTSSALGPLRFYAAVLPPTLRGKSLTAIAMESGKALARTPVAPSSPP